jgi:hypothetical protein
MINPLDCYSETVKSQSIIKPVWAEAPAPPAPSVHLPDSKSWELLNNDFYYNKTNLIKSSNTVSVWTYRIITADERNFLTDYFRESDSEKSIKYQTLDHQTMLLNIDCKKKLSKILKLINYDNQENVLYAETFRNSEWKSIIPGSNLEGTYKKICATPTPSKKHKKRIKTKKRSEKITHRK